ASAFVFKINVYTIGTCGLGDEQRNVCSPCDDDAFFALRSCHQLLRGDSGEFFSPDYLCSNPSLWCNWTVQVDPGKRIHLYLEDLTPDDVCHLKQDQVHVDEPAGRFGVHKVLQKCWREAKFTTSTNALTVVLLIGGWPDSPYRGFYGRYQAFGPPVIYNPQEVFAARDEKSEPPLGPMEVTEFGPVTNGGHYQPSLANFDPMYDYDDQRSALTPEDAADAEVGEQEQQPQCGVPNKVLGVCEVRPCSHQKVNHRSCSLASVPSTELLLTGRFPARGLSLNVLCLCQERVEQNRLCVPDVNECGTQLVLCDANADCVNRFGSYSCHCRPGFLDESRLGSGGTICVDAKAAGARAPNCCGSGLSVETKGVYVLFFLLSSLILMLLAAAGMLYRRHHRGAFLVRCRSGSICPPDPDNIHQHHDGYPSPADSDMPPPPPPPRAAPRDAWPQVKELCPAVDLPLLRFSPLVPSDGYLEPRQGRKM
uniref:EGF-like domain-containing protein n=1 Tax=Scophthalmus maximus TaxID=52904 RepID=A0A8D3BHI5_SCOMX